MQTMFFRPIDLLKIRNLKVNHAKQHLFGLIAQAGAVEDVQIVQPQLNRQGLHLQSALPNMQRLLVNLQAVGQPFGNSILGRPKGQRAADDHNVLHETGEFHLVERIRQFRHRISLFFSCPHNNTKDYYAQLIMTLSITERHKLIKGEKNEKMVISYGYRCYDDGRNGSGG